MVSRSDVFESDFFAVIQEHLSTSDPIRTLNAGRPNWIIAIELRGLLVETERTRMHGTGARFVPAWMLDVAWQRLRSRGRLTNRELLETSDLNVKRSSFVCAALAHLPGAEVFSTHPIILTYTPDA